MPLYVMVDSRPRTGAWTLNGVVEIHGHTFKYTLKCHTEFVLSRIFYLLQLPFVFCEAQVRSEGAFVGLLLMAQLEVAYSRSWHDNNYTEAITIIISRQKG